MHYDSNLEENLTVDSSLYGIGAVISHVFENEKRSICFVSRTLTNAEKGYSALGKEATVIVWGVNRSYQYLYGRKFNLYTDNGPLVSIFGPNHGIPAMVANRLQRFAFFLSGFDFTNYTVC